MSTLDPRGQAAPMTLDEEEAELARPVVCLMPASAFSDGCSVLRFSEGRAQKVLRAVKKLLRADRFSKGAVCMLGAQLRPGRHRYEHDLARRRAESVKAVLCGDKTRAEMIMRRIYKAETSDRKRNRWLYQEANDLLHVFYPEMPLGDGQPRVRKFQEEYGLRVDGLPARDTFEVLLEEYASAVSIMGWVIPGRIYTAIGSSGVQQGSVEIWVWPAWPPPNGGRTAWVTRSPIVMHPADAPDPPAPESESQDETAGPEAAPEEADAAEAPAAS